MQVHLVDGTYELFRHFFGMPQTTDAGGQEIGAVRGVVNSMLMMLEKGTTHIGVATDHVIESFRNDLFAHYKTGEGIPHELFSQFPILEESLASLGVRVWPMVEFEADDALAAAAAKAAQDERVNKVIICTPDKDLGQCVVGSRIVQLDRRKNEYRDAEGVLAKFGVKPQSIPDYLAVVGDTADGYPGLKGWGAKGAASVLSIYEHLENIPRNVQDWDPSIKSAAKLAATLFSCLDEAILYRRLATLRLDVPVFDAVDDLRWRGPRQDFDVVCQRLKLPDAARRARALAATASAAP